MVDNQYSMDIYKSINISIGTSNEKFRNAKIRS